MHPEAKPWFGGQTELWRRIAGIILPWGTLRCLCFCCTLNPPPWMDPKQIAIIRPPHDTEPPPHTHCTLGHTRTHTHAHSHTHARASPPQFFLFLPFIHGPRPPTPFRRQLPDIHFCVFLLFSHTHSLSPLSSTPLLSLCVRPVHLSWKATNTMSSRHMHIGERTVKGIPK